MPEELTPVDERLERRPIRYHGTESLGLSEVDQLVDLAFDSFESDRDFLDSRPQRQLSTRCLKAQGLLGAEVDPFPVKVTGERLPVVDEAAEVSVLGCDLPVLLQQLAGAFGELEVLTVCLTKRCDVGGDLHPVDNEVSRSSTNLFGGIEHLVDKRRHRRWRPFDDHPAARRGDLDGTQRLAGSVIAVALVLPRHVNRVRDGYAPDNDAGAAAVQREHTPSNW